jgi:hypothetical protein
MITEQSTLHWLRTRIIVSAHANGDRILGPSPELHAFDNVPATGSRKGFYYSSLCGEMVEGDGKRPPAGRPPVNERCRKCDREEQIRNMVFYPLPETKGGE